MRATSLYEDDSILRLFLGYAPHVDTRQLLAREVAQVVLPQGSVPVPSDNYHITQYFFGAIRIEMLDNIKSLIQLGIRGFGPFPLTFDRYCLAPPKQETRMIWALYQPHPEFEALSQNIHELFLQIFPDAQARKKPLPHVTLARIKPGATASLGGLKPPPLVWQANELVLWKSEKTYLGTRYSPLATFPLSPTLP